jgi:hypothetical protein
MHWPPAGSFTGQKRNRHGQEDRYRSWCRRPARRHRPKRCPGITAATYQRQSPGSKRKNTIDPSPVSVAFWIRLGRLEVATPLLFYSVKEFAPRAAPRPLARRAPPSKSSRRRKVRPAPADRLGSCGPDYLRVSDKGARAGYCAAAVVEPVADDSQLGISLIPGPPIGCDAETLAGFAGAVRTLSAQYRSDV